MGSPVQRNIERDLRFNLPAIENLLILRDEIRQDRNSRSICHKLLDRLQLRCAKYNVWREAMLRAIIENSTILKSVRLLHDELFLAQPRERNNHKLFQRMFGRQAQTHLVFHDEEFIRAAFLRAAENNTKVEFS